MSKPHGIYYQTTLEHPKIELGTHLWEFLWALGVRDYDIVEIVCKAVRLGRDGRDPIDCAERMSAMNDILLERLELERDLELRD